MSEVWRRWSAALGQPPTWPRWFWPLFALGLVVNLTPLIVAPILPFADLHGAAGLLGALVHRGDPAARIDDYFAFNIRPAPNVLYWAVCWALTGVFSVTTATNIYIALFCVVALPVSFLVLLRAHGKDPVLCFLAFPVIYHRCLWFGFMGSVPAVPLLFLIMAFASRAFSHPRWSWRDGALALALLTLSTAHAFLYLVALALVVLWALLAFRQPSSMPRRLAAVVPSLLFLGPYLGASLFGRRADGGGFGALVRHVWTQRKPFSTYLRDIHDWLINGYRGSVDEVVAAIFAATLVALLVLGTRPISDRHPHVDARGSRWSDRLWSQRTIITVALLGVGYFVLPMTIAHPISWWAVNVRLLVPFLLTTALLIPTRRWGLPRVAVLPVMAAAIFYGAFVTHDFRKWWMAVELDGFSQALAAVPPGKRLHALYPPFDNERHYSHFPMGYIVDYYVAERGGTATPILWGPKELLVSWRPQGPSAPWGLASGFRWAAHGPSWDYFLAKQPAPGNGPRLSHFTDAPPGAVTKVFERGLWSLWKRGQ